MSVYKRGDFWHYDFTIDGGRYRGATRQRSKAAALRVETRERERAVLGETPRPVPTVEQAADRWFAARIDGKKSDKTTAQRLDIMLRLVGAHTLVNDIDTPDIEDAIQRRRLEVTRQGKAPSNATVNRDLIDTTLRPLLRYCRRVLKVKGLQEIEWGELRLSEPSERTRTFTPDEIAAWRGELPAWHRDLFDFIGRYGVRLREAFFHPDAVDVPGAMVTIRPIDRKNRRGHTVRLLPEDAADLAARIGRARAAQLETVWFREMKNGKLRPIHWRGFQSASRAALERACVADARPVHDLRHHAATAALRAPRGNLKTVQKLLGHKSIASTARYAHADDDDVLDALRHVADTMTERAETKAKESKALKASGTGT